MTVSRSLLLVRREDAAEQIATIHKERFAGDKPLADLIRGLKSYSGSSKPE